LKTLDLLCAGEAFEDLVFLDLPRLPRPGDEVKTSHFERTFGGGALITAIAASRLGLRCGVLSGLAADAETELRREGVRVRNLRRASEPHAITAALSTRHERSFATFNGVNDVLEPRLRAALRRPRVRHVHLALSPPDCARWASVVSGLRKEGISTSWDPGWNEALPKDRGFDRFLGALDYVLVNDKEALLYARRRTLEAACDRFRSLTRNTVIKLGAKGSRWVTPRGVPDLRVAAPRVRVVDTTGAGDAWNGGFLFALLRGETPRRCLTLANFVGSMSTRAAGGIRALPQRKDLP